MLGQAKWVLVVFALFAASLSAEANIQPTRLRCEALENSLGIGDKSPRLGWWLTADHNNADQSAYRIVVASSLGRLQSGNNDLWDSGKVASSGHAQIEYKGRPLKSERTYYWKVRVWDEKGHATWSSPNHWTMAFIDPKEWKAQWIGAENRIDLPPPANVFGWHALEATSPDTVKWVQIDLGKPYELDKIRLFPPVPQGTNIGFGFPIRFRIEGANDPDFEKPVVISDHSSKDFPNPGNRAVDFEAPANALRYIRVTATKLWNRGNGGAPYCFALAEIQAITNGKNVALHAKPTALDSVERSGWGLTEVIDGVVPHYHRAAANERRPRTEGERIGENAFAQNNPPYAAPLLRKTFQNHARPTKAIVTVTGLGYYELNINGKRVGDHQLDPGFTDFSKHVLYSTYDVTSLLKPGTNAIAAILGTGFYDVTTNDAWDYPLAPWVGSPRLKFQLRILYGDGHSRVIVSDGSWRMHAGPIKYNSLRAGETYDARRIVPHWKEAAYDDSKWAHVKVVRAPAGVLQPQMEPPIRVVRKVKPSWVKQLPNGDFVFKFPVNMAGWADLYVPNPGKGPIKLVYGETLNEDGSVNTSLAGLTHGRFQTEEVILTAQNPTYHPRFTYHGFQCVQVSGLAAADPGTLTAYEVHTDPHSNADFACSNEVINRFHTAERRTQLNNLHSIPTDCPHREKNGWTADGAVTAPEAIHNFDMQNFYEKWIQDMLDAQDPNGHAACIAPSPGWGKSNPDGSPGVLSDPWWGGAIVRTPWDLYRYYGDKRILERTYPAMKRYLDYVARYSPGDISWSIEGDWLEVGSDDGPSKRTPASLCGTAAYYLHTKIVAATALLLGHKKEAEKYTRLAARINQNFHAKYFDREAASYSKDSQTAQALPLYFGMTSAEDRPSVEKTFLGTVDSAGGHVSCGFIGVYYVFEELMREGRNDLAYAMLTKPDYPGWAYMLKDGGTTIWEDWKGGNSRDHPALGSVDAWIYEALAGIRLAPGSAGYKDFIVKPAVVGDLKWVDCTLPTINGVIRSSWKIRDGRLTLSVEVPVGSHATIYVPQSGGPDLYEVHKVGSGRYVFQSNWPID